MEASWHEAHPKDRPPTMQNMDTFVGSPFWGQLQTWLDENYASAPQMAYSGCGGQPGWNLKYKKSGKALCVLYPLSGHFIALVVVGPKEQAEAERALPGMSKAVQNLYKKAELYNGARWLMVNVQDEAVLQDVKQLIALRKQPGGFRKKAP